MLFKKIVGGFQILVSLGLLGTAFYISTNLKKQVKTYLVDAGNLERLTETGPEIELINQLIESGSPTIIITILGILIGVIGLLFLLQGVINLLPDSKKIVEAETTQAKEEKQPEKNKEFTPGNEY